MSGSGVLLLLGFVAFAGLMAARLLPTLLALPLMAAFIAWVAGLSFTAYLECVLLGGAMKLSGAVVVVIFGAMFAEVVKKTGISGAIVKQAAELAGDRPLSIAVLMAAATAFLFLGMSGLGAVLMAGSIALPILTGAGIAPLRAVTLMLLSIMTGLMANTANYGTYIGIFGGEVVTGFYLPAILIAALVTAVYILRNICRPGDVGSLAGIIPALLRGLLSVPGSFFRALGRLFRRRDEGLLRKKRALPAAALIAPVLPLVFIFGAKAVYGFGPAAKGMIDPVAAAALGFVIAALYAAILTRPGQAVNLFTGAFVDGIKDVAGVIFLFMGIGMLLAAAMTPSAAAILDPLLAALLPSGKLGVLCFFLLFAPAALYRGPLNMFGMGAGIAALLSGLGTIPPEPLCGLFLAVSYVQGISDPTNSHNTWLAGFAGVEPSALLRETLPYSWLMCLLMLLYVMTVWGA
ncbi:MAG: hypothetical protein IK136_00685 [Oscillospiraceae bacterium]|nr:hypothetical protein [Oscillospiraceae bacterium]